MPGKLLPREHVTSLELILYSMWHELRVVLHNRENTLLSQALQTFAREEHMHTENVLHNWASLCEAVESMPYE